MSDILKSEPSITTTPTTVSVPGPSLENVSPVKSPDNKDLGADGFEKGAQGDADYSEKLMQRTKIEQELTKQLVDTGSVNIFPGKWTELLKDVSYKGKVPSTLDFTSDKDAASKLLIAIHEKLQDLSKNDKDFKKDLLGSDPAINAIMKEFVAEDKLKDYQSYDVLITFMTYRFLNEAKTEFKKLYPSMDKAEGFNTKDIPYTISFEGGKTKIDFEVSDELKTAEKEAGKKASVVPGVPLTEAQKKEGVLPVEKVDVDAQVKVIKESWLGHVLAFMGFDDAKYEEVAKGGGWGFIIRPFVGLGGAMGKGWDNFVDAIKDVPLIGAAAPFFKSVGTEIGKFAKKMSGDKTTETAEARKITKSEFIELASKPGGLKDDSKNILIDDSIKYSELQSGTPKYDYVELQVPKAVDGKKDLIKGMEGNKVCKVENGVEKPCSTTSEPMDIEMIEGTYRFRCDLAKMILGKGCTIALHKASDVPEKPTAAVS